MTPEQLRMARAALRIGVRELAEMSDTAPATITRFETEKGGIQLSTAERIQAALEGEGVQFLSETDAAKGPGVVLVRKDDQ
ncbi:helix-turn-helix transcriptional regulator [Ruegeria sp. NA]|nr:helix-turn-helix transcriptional regulator [Ruegeria sp. NA]MCX8955341.1 helix-turn-helix transcriptional regulator [Ruegeria sp. NA]